MTLFNFFKKNKNTNKINKDNFSENGLNEIYFTNGTGLIKERFFKKKGLEGDWKKRKDYFGLWILATIV